jgi:hypothetical protein
MVYVRQHIVLEGDPPSLDRVEDQHGYLMHIKQRLNIKNHIIPEFPNAPQSA